MMIWSKAADFLRELRRRNLVFYYLGVGLFGLFIVFLVNFALCQFHLSRICFWLKPFKFTLSFGMYVFSLGWYMEYLKKDRGIRWIKGMSSLIAALVTIEMAIIFMQSSVALAGDLLHISKHTAEVLGRNLFLWGNGIIIANTCVATYIGSQFYRKINLEPVSYLWGIRAGFLIFTLSGLIGIFLIAKYGQTRLDPHQYGIPLLQLSSVRDYLITLHFLGIHCLQAVPFCCYFFQKLAGKTFAISCVGMYVACIFYFTY